MAKSPFVELSRRERQVLEIIYAEGALTVNEVLDLMPDPPSNSALRTTLRALEAKGQLVHEQDGPRYVYRPAVSREKARRAALRHMVRTFFDGRAGAAAVALLRMEDMALPAAELDRLEKQIEDAMREGR